MELLGSSLLALRDYLAARGIAFVFIVVPNKENVYPEHVPPQFHRISDLSRADALLSVFRETSEMPVATPKPALLSHKPVRLVYYEYDSHWNHVGAYIGAQTALAALGRPTVPVEQRVVVPADAPDAAADLAGMLGIPAISACNSTEFTVVGIPFRHPERENWRSLGIVENPESRTSDTLLILGDSFKFGFAPPFLEEFRRVADMHWNYCSDFHALLEELHPNAVVLEFAERYLPDAFITVPRLLPPP